ncbi:hypothetical protein, partial [Salmonella sp. M307]|uniref:hypothetical protein n=1 Tax=Salmonella sp. M307 TaxID=3240310 RepID=UPI00352A6D0A
TRQEIEDRLEFGLINKMVCFETVKSEKIIGKVQKLAVNVHDKELMVVFQLRTTKVSRYEVDLQYFIENTEILYGDTYTGERRNIQW